MLNLDSIINASKNTTNAYKEDFIWYFAPRMKSHVCALDGNTFTTMIEGVSEKAIQQGISDSLTFEKGIKDLYRTAEPDGVFSYTFFKGFGTKK